MSYKEEERNLKSRVAAQDSLAADLRAYRGSDSASIMAILRYMRTQRMWRTRSSEESSLLIPKVTAGENPVEEPISPIVEAEMEDNGAVSNSEEQVITSEREYLIF